MHGASLESVDSLPEREPAEAVAARQEVREGGRAQRPSARDLVDESGPITEPACPVLLGRVYGVGAEVVREYDQGVRRLVITDNRAAT